MKKIFLAAAFASTALFTSAQIGNVLKHAKDKAASTANNKANSTVDNTVDKTVNGTDTNDPNSTSTNQNTPANNTTQSNANNTADTAGQHSQANSAPVSIKAYSKYDFVPGEKIVVLEDFMQDAIGDFPDKWNTNSSGEIVTIDKNQGHWLMMPRTGVFMPEFIDSLPDNFTFEYDLFCIHGNKLGGWGTFQTAICELSNREKIQEWQFADNNYYFSVYGGNASDATISYARKKEGNSEGGVQITTHQLADKSKPCHVSLWRQKERLRVYFNEEKVLDIPKALTPGANYNSIIYVQPDADEENYYAISNLRLAVGAPDTRNKMLTENKWVTHGILFDVNSANIKPESYGTLKEMANVLKENPDLKVKIIGHTDADGSDAANLDLSKRRAAAVKDELTTDFGIDASRMQADGKGESEPIDKSDTPAGKANNRRVEFIKL
ncbi:MAG TPA: OmpA family protein [Parafilimonas sp.]|nr:OmpA family protein [Parafilimonas sp.]